MAAAGSPTGSASGRPQAAPLEEGMFRHFGPLLQDCQGYAALSGCRFRSNSFDGLPTGAKAAGAAPAAVSSARARDPGPRLAAKLRAADVVADFTARLRAGEEGLVEEVDRAFRIVMTESVRNAMQGMFQALEMFPPSPPPAGVDDEDCAYEDLSAPLPAVAQRLYNDQVRRLSDACGAPGRLERRAMTAAFIVDFAEGVGVKLPEIPETQQGMLRDLSARVADETARRGRGPEEQTRVRGIFLENLGGGAAAERLRGEAGKWWAENRRSVLWGVATTAVVLGAAVASTALRSRAEAQRRRSAAGDEDNELR